jgi:peptidoglycan/LPS O-acetylase OafA/YrhL
VLATVRQVRNPYLDLLRAAAIVRVIVYHLFGWPWLTIALPAMGVMFALAGSLMAASLDERHAGRVISSRLRRVLPPLWAFASVAVPLMIAGGWLREDGEHPFDVAGLVFWIVPLLDPVGSERGIDAWEPLWYLRAYLWFVVLSPLLYLLYRRVGWVAVAAPIVLLAILHRPGFALPGVADAALWDFATYGACWIAGFAHHDGRLARTRPWAVAGTAAVLGAAALYRLHGHPGGSGLDLNEVPEAQAWWSLAFVLVVLRWQPSMRRLDRVRPVRSAVAVLNARAVTVYLWHNVMIAAAWPLLGLVALGDLGVLDGPVTLAAVLLLTAGATAMVGWVEDLAARRRPRLWPGPSTRPRDAAAQAAAPYDRRHLDAAGHLAPRPSAPGAQPAVPDPSGASAAERRSRA